MRWFLDKLYIGSGALACAFLASIALLVIVQILTRILGFLIPGLIEFATYAMVASTFLGIAYTLNVDGHIRVSLVTHAMPAAVARVMNAICFALAAALMSYFAWYAIVLVYQAWQFGYRDMGIAAIPLWIPQSGMAIGACVAAIGFWDGLVGVLTGSGALMGGSDQHLAAEQGTPAELHREI